jgi:hypothetical protein
MRIASVLSVVLLALLLPATTAAASPFTSTVLKNACSTSGGAYGYGRIVLKVEATEWGKSGANYMAFRARAQARLNGTWVTVETTKWKTDTFANDAGSWTFRWGAKWAFTRASHPLTRIKMRIQFWDQRSGPDVLLATHNYTSKAC